jgi:intracellular septation protein A
VTAALPLVFVFGVLTLMLHRSREIRAFHLLVIGLFGFFLAETGVAGLIRSVISWLIAGFFHQH